MPEETGQQQGEAGQAGAEGAAAGQGQGEGQAAAGTPDPNSVEGLQGRLARRRQALDDAKAQLRTWQDLGVTPERVAELVGAQQQAGQQPAAVDEAAIRAQVSAELTAQSNRRVLEADLRAAAAAKLADPEDALRFIDLGAIELGADGRAHRDDLAEVIGGLLEKKPYLAVQTAAPEPRFAGAAGGGARLPESPKTLAQQIAEAEKAGDLATSMRLKTQQLTEVQRTT